MRGRGGNVRVEPFQQRANNTRGDLRDFDRKLRLYDSKGQERANPSQGGGDTVHDKLTRNSMLYQFCFRKLLSQLHFFRSIRRAIHVVHRRGREHHAVQITIRTIRSERRGPVQFGQVKRLPRGAVRELRTRGYRAKEGTFGVRILPQGYTCYGEQAVGSS